MKKFVVSKETEDVVGMEIVEDRDPECLILRDIDEIDKDPSQYVIFRKDIPKIIEGLKLFAENKSMSREEFIAFVRHIGWVYYQIAAGQPYNEVANEDQTKSLVDGIRYADAHTDMTPEQNHENWMQMKISQGWVYGPVKDFDKKTHPDLVPFDQLPDVEKRKDTADHIGHYLASKLWDQMEGKA
jgi:hypothetical protein